MADPVTSNKSFIKMATGTASGTWGAVLNASMIDLADQSLGNTVSVAISSSNVNLTTTQIQNLAVKLTGALSNAVSVTLPLSANSTSVAVGGFFVFDNQSTGAFAVTVKTIASGSTGVEVPQGARSVVYSDGTNVTFADDAQNQTVTYNGNPNGNLAGSAGSASTRASRVINRATNEEYLCTTSGTASVAVWSKNLPYTFESQGYLTASSDATSPILTADSIGATTIYYTAFRGNLMFLYNGVSFVPVTITGGQLSLALSSSAQAANGIYDVIGFLDGTTPRIAFSPAWTTATAGSGTRGTGGGTPQLSRVNGILVNAVQQTVNNGSTTYIVAANRGTYLGSVLIDSSAGQVTCHVTYGQSRKFGVWNAYNRENIYLKGGDPTASWSDTVVGWRPSNNDSANNITAFTGLAEEKVGIEFSQSISPTNVTVTLGIGVNSTSSPSGYVAPYTIIFGRAEYVSTVPFLGQNKYTSLERPLNNNGAILLGTETNMLLAVGYRG